jgi:phosphatidylserine decarboxylase
MDSDHFLVAPQPVAVRSSIDVFGLNKRVVLEIESQPFGRVAFVIIGAVQVGSISLSVWQGQAVAKVGSSVSASAQI